MIYNINVFAHNLTTVINKAGECGRDIKSNELENLIKLNTYDFNNYEGKDYLIEVEGANGETVPLRLNICGEDKTSNMVNIVMGYWGKNDNFISGYVRHTI